MPSHVFTKLCGTGGRRKSRRGCGKEFQTSIRHERFCPDCKVPAAVKRRQDRKRRAQYVKDRKRLLAENRSRRAARLMLIEETLAPCFGCKRPFPIKQLECDHEDGNPLNNHPTNRVWRCESCHKSKTRQQLAGAYQYPEPVQMLLLEDAQVVSILSSEEKE